jgi:hypothetical protein
MIHLTHEDYLKMLQEFNWMYAFSNKDSIREKGKIDHNELLLASQVHPDFEDMYREAYKEAYLKVVK